MAYREIYALTLLFLFVHASLLTFGFVDGVAPYNRLASNLALLNSEINPQGTLEQPSENVFDPNTGNVQQQPNYVTIVGLVFNLAPDTISTIIYLFTGVFQTMEALYFPASIVFIIGVFVTVVQTFGLIQFFIEILQAIKLF